MIHRTSLPLFLFFLSLIGCTADEPEVITPRSRRTSVAAGSPVRIEKAPQVPKKTDVEVLWEIPNEPVDGFFIHYGYDRTRLINTLRVKVDELGRFDDPKHGFVFRYILKGVASDRPIFIAIAAYKGDEVSPPSGVFSVMAGGR